MRIRRRRAARWRWGRARRIALATSELEDAIEVLTDGPLPLYPAAVELLDQALGLEVDAQSTSGRADRNAMLQKAELLKDEARALILE